MNAMYNFSIDNLFNIPNELKQLPQWVGFIYPNKQPLTFSGRPASVKDPNDWMTYQEATSALILGVVNGLGFVFTEADGFCGIDLDKCIDVRTRQIEPWALAIINQFSEAYIEYSPSGFGMHIIVRAKLPAKGRRKGKLEIYDNGRYFTMTGNVYKKKDNYDS